MLDLISDFHDQLLRCQRGPRLIETPRAKMMGTGLSILGKRGRNPARGYLMLKGRKIDEAPTINKAIGIDFEGRKEIGAAIFDKDMTPASLNAFSPSSMR